MIFLSRDLLDLVAHKLILVAIFGHRSFPSEDPFFDPLFGSFSARGKSMIQGFNSTVEQNKIAMFLQYWIPVIFHFNLTTPSPLIPSPTQVPNSHFPPRNMELKFEFLGRLGFQMKRQILHRRRIVRGLDLGWKGPRSVVLPTQWARYYIWGIADNVWVTPKKPWPNNEWFCKIPND